MEKGSVSIIGGEIEDSLVSLEAICSEVFSFSEESFLYEKNKYPPTIKI